jgi:hypothetical protein
VAQGGVGGAGESGWVLGIGGGGRMRIEANMLTRAAVGEGAGKELTVLRFCCSCLIIAYSNCIVGSSLAIV